MLFSKSATHTQKEQEPTWNIHEEGQLAIDVGETPNEIIVRAAIAGVHEKDLDIHLTEDLITIRGIRQEEPLPPHTVMHYEECFWGAFSRSIILPCRIRTDEAEATLKNGVLTIHAPKSRERTSLRITPHT